MYSIRHLGQQSSEVIKKKNGGELDDKMSLLKKKKEKEFLENGIEYLVDMAFGGTNDDSE